MKRLLITTACFIYSTFAIAQSEAKLYATTDDYVKNKPTVTVVTIEKRSSGSIAMVGGSDYKIFSEDDKELSKQLKKEYFLVERSDSLFVNFKHIGGNWYGLSFLRNDKYVFFIGAESKLKNSADMAAMFGAMGGLASAGAKYNYVLRLADGEVSFVTKKVMKEILGDTELYNRYIREQYPYSNETIVKYLEEFYK